MPRMLGSRPPGRLAASDSGAALAIDAESVNRVLWTIPNVLCLIGSRSGDEWNGMTASWVTQVSMDPVLVAVSVDATAVTNRLIRDGGSFSINLWSRDDTRPFVKFSKPATKEGLTLNGRADLRGSGCVDRVLGVEDHRGRHARRVSR